MAEQMRVFLSYGRGDDEPFVKEIHRFLTDNAISAWYDRTDLPSRGEAFTAEIARAIESADRMILFIGEHSAASEWCKREWMHALKHCIPVIPVLVQHTFKTLPDSIRQALPESVFAVSGFEFPPDQRENAPQKILNLLTNAENLPLAELKNVPIFTTYMDRPQYIAEIKRYMRLSDPTDIDDARTAEVGITTKETTAGLQGIAGIGKTTLATALAHECEVRRTFEYIIWLPVGQAKRRADAPVLLRMLADQINEHEEQFADEYRDETSARLRVQSLLVDKRVLLVLDDVWDKGLLELFSFSLKHFRLLVTTRGKHLLSENLVEIDRLTDDEGVRLIAHYIDPTAPDAVLLLPEYKQIVQELNGHTLAIKVIATLLRTQGTHEAVAYLDRLRGLKHTNLFDFLEEDTLNDPDETQRNRSVELSFSLSYDALTPQHQAYFRALGIFAPNSRFHIAALQHVWDIDDHLIAKKAVTALQNVGLLDDASDDRYSQHPLLRAYAHTLLQCTDELDNVFNTYADFFTTCAGAIFCDLQPEDWHKHDADLPDITALGVALTVRTEKGTRGDLKRAIDFANNVVNYVHRRMEIGHGPWLEMGLNAVYTLRAVSPGDNTLKKGEAMFLSANGTVWSIQGEQQKALEYYQQALLMYRAVDDQVGEAAVLNNIGPVYRSLGEPHKALDYYKQALALFRKMSDSNGEGNTLGNIGAVWSALGEKRRALEYYEQALPLRRAAGDRVGEAFTLNNIGLVWDDLGERYKALEYYQQSLHLFQVVGDQRGQATALSNIGTTLNEVGDPRNALVYYEQALLTFRAVGDRNGEATTYNNIGSVWDILGDKRKALEYCQLALHLCHAIGDRSGEATTLNNIGRIWDDLGEKRKALEYYEQALLLCRAVQDRLKEAGTLNNIGAVWDELGEKHKALEIYEQVLQLRRAVGDRSGEATTLNNIAQAWTELGNNKRALDLFEQALKLYRAVGNLRGEATTLNNIAGICSEEGNLPKAVEMLYQIIPIVQEMGAAAEEALYRHNLASALFTIGQTAEAIKELETAVVILRQNNLRYSASGGSIEQYESRLAKLRRIGTTPPAVPSVLPDETVNVLAGNTFAVMTDRPEKRDAWNQDLQDTREDFARRGDDWAIEVAFVDALLAVLDDQPVALPMNNPYASVIGQIWEAIEQYRKNNSK